MIKKGLIILGFLLAVQLIACGNVSSTTTGIVTCETPNVLIAGACVDENSEKITGLTFTLEELQADYDQLIELLDLHNPNAFTVQAEYDQAVLSQRALLQEGMSEIEFLRILAPVVAAIRCGHTSVYVSSNSASILWSDAMLLPLDLRIIDNRLYVVGNHFATGIMLKSEIVTINGISSEEIISKMVQSLGSDGENQTMKYARINNDVSFFYYLYVDTSLELDVSYKEPGSSTIITISLQAVSNTQIKDEIEYEEYVPYQSSFSENYAYLQISSFYPEGEYGLYDYFDFYEAFFEEVANQEIQNIILDLRGNSGGDPRTASRLFSYLAKESQPYFSASSPNYYTGLKSDVPLTEPHFDGNLYTVINGECFSTTGHFLALLEYQDIGGFIGEESGASFRCSDTSGDYILFNTGFRLHSSNVIWEVAVSGLELGRGIMPDYEVSLSLDDIINNEDSILNYVINLITESN